MSDKELASVVRGLLVACKELMKEHGARPKGVTDWAIVNDAMVAGEHAIRPASLDLNTKSR